MLRLKISVPDQGLKPTGTRRWWSRCDAWGFARDCLFQGGYICQLSLENAKYSFETTLSFIQIFFLTAVIVTFAHVCSAGFAYLGMDNITIFHPLPSKRIISQFSAPRGLRGRDLLMTSDDFSRERTCDSIHVWNKTKPILSMVETPKRFHFRFGSKSSPKWRKQFSRWLSCYSFTISC